jgi:hypothetical protein
VRLSELIGRPVVDVRGKRVGAVADVVLVQDGPMLGPYSASFRCAGLIVAERPHTRLLGYERTLRPVLVRWLVQRRAGAVRHVAWELVEQYDEDAVRLSSAVADLPEHDPTARRR